MSRFPAKKKSPQVAALPHRRRSANDALRLHQDLRLLIRQMLTAQDNERTQLSQTLRNRIAQTLLGINVRLLALQREGKIRSQGLARGIDSTQQLLARSARIMHRVAREFRRA